MPRYIDAERLERFVKRDEWDTPDERWRPESEFGRFVDAVPTEDVVPVVHAYWMDERSSKKPIKVDKDGCPQGSCYCSNCLEWLVASDEYPVIGKYCPNCGARMDEETSK